MAVTVAAAQDLLAHFALTFDPEFLARFVVVVVWPPAPSQSRAESWPCNCPGAWTCGPQIGFGGRVPY